MYNYNIVLIPDPIWLNKSEFFAKMGEYQS